MCRGEWARLLPGTVHIHMSARSPACPQPLTERWLEQPFLYFLHFTNLFRSSGRPVHATPPPKQNCVGSRLVHPGMRCRRAVSGALRTPVVHRRLPTTTIANKAAYDRLHPPAAAFVAAGAAFGCCSQCCCCLACYCLLRLLLPCLLLLPLLPLLATPQLLLLPPPLLLLLLLGSPHSRCRPISRLLCHLR